MHRKIILLFIALIYLGQFQLFYGRTVRVVSLAPNLTEILFALGLTEKEIVGITDYCNYPKETARIPKIGSLTTASTETIVSLKPDYVFSAGSNLSPLNSRLKQAGLNMVILNAENIDGVYSNILTIGKILDREEIAKTICSEMRARLKKIEDRIKKISDRKKVYVEIWDDPITSCGKGSLVDEVLARAGGINITGNIDILYPTINQEIIIKENPDFIILGYMSRSQKNSVDAVLNRFGWQEINAVKEGNVIADINPDIFLRPGPRIVEGIEEIHKRIYGKKDK